MADNTAPDLKPTLGLTGLTMNAMALIAPGAFLWLTFFIQATTGASAPSMWMGIIFALLLCLATAVCYAEMSKLYPGTGSSYYFAEQSFLNHEKHWKYARLSKFIIGWGSHLYYWIYPGVMVGTMGLLCGYLVGTIWPNFMNASNPGPAFMMVVAVVFAFTVAYIANRGVNGSTAINIAINVIQITALVVFSILALSYRMNHPPGSEAWQFDSQSGDAYNYEFAMTKTVVDGKPTDTVVRDKDGNPQPLLANGKPVPYKISYPDKDEKGNFLTHADGASVVGVHDFNWVLLQATVAILILVGFESVTAMGGEAKNAKRDVPIAVIVSLLVQGAVCYTLEYFAANYFLNSGYTMQSAAGSAAPIGDMMIVVGNAILGPGMGKTFMLIEAFTVFLALIGTTLSCMNTGARVTYAMGKDAEVPEHFGMLHSETLTPHRALWFMGAISAVVGCVAVSVAFGDAGAPADTAIKALPAGFFSSFGYSSHDAMAKLPNTLLTMTLASNFGTFLLYMLSCFTCIVAFNPRMPEFSFLKHRLIPVFGLAANLACMLAYLLLPLFGIGTKMEPFCALGIAACWAIYGGIYFVSSSKASGRTTLIKNKAGA